MCTPVRYTIRSEQRAFARRLATEPLFLLMHSRALGLAVIRRLRSRIVIALSSAHRGRKIRPLWLDALGPSRASHCAAIAPAGLPIYPCRIHEGANESIDILGIRIAGEDHEDYLARHRWGFLLERMLDNCVDWRACIEACVQWTKANSDTADRAWEPYSACERVANLAVFLAAMPPATREPEIPPQIREFLDRSLRWVHGHLEYYGPTETNNHILNNARALVLGGIVGGDPAAVSAGMQIFRWCLPEMILRGGFLRERSSHYQLIVLNWVLDAWRFVAAAEGPDGEDTRFLAGYADRMRTAASMLCGRGTSLLAVIGDVSPDITPLQSLGRLALLYPDWWPHTYRSESLAVSDGWFRLSKEDETVLGNFPEGPFPCDFPTHGHSDHTSFVWSHDGKEVLVDPGRYRYTPDEVSLAQVGAVSHNLPTVNGLAPLCESMVQRGGWWPLPYAAAQLRAAAVTDGIVLEHDGFARATPVKRHSRRIEPQLGGLQVVDSFEGSGTVDLSFYWHFGEGFENFDSSRMLAIGQGGNVRVDVRDKTGTRDRIPLVVELLSGRISAQYGRTLPSIRVRLGCRVNLPATIATKFSWVGGAG
jgi:hypothetical protein